MHFCGRDPPSYPTSVSTPPLRMPLSIPLHGWLRPLAGWLLSAMLALNVGFAAGGVSTKPKRRRTLFHPRTATSERPYSSQWRNDNAGDVAGKRITADEVVDLMPSTTIVLSLVESAISTLLEPRYQRT
jgi:hypothetical protein